VTEEPDPELCERAAEELNQWGRHLTASIVRTVLLMPQWERGPDGRSSLNWPGPWLGLAQSEQDPVPACVSSRGSEVSSTVADGAGWGSGRNVCTLRYQVVPASGQC
jgi:hypothetical protein